MKLKNQSFGNQPLAQNKRCGASNHQSLPYFFVQKLVKNILIPGIGYGHNALHKFLNLDYIIT
jgi:hypothetical protein